jgi:glycosyltransferase involved in cell wall biosynthesis
MKVSIIAVDYEHHVPRYGAYRGLLSISEQTSKDFELIIVHDGPKEVPYEQEFDFKELNLNPIITNTHQRMNDWGHSSRDWGMRMANGDYFLQFNIDNVLYPDAIEEICKKIDESGTPIIIFSIIHHKDNDKLYTGIPPDLYNIDCMQLVGHRDMWQELDYWYDKRDSSDGWIYEVITRKYDYSDIEKCLGENF